MLDLLFLVLIVSWCVSIWIALRCSRHWFFVFFTAATASILFMLVWAIVVDIVFEMKAITQTGACSIAIPFGIMFSPIPGLLAVVVMLIKSRYEKRLVANSLPNPSLPSWD